MTTSSENPSTESSDFAIGARVQIQTGYADWHEGHIVDIDEKSGEIVVKDDDGNRWIGHEDHLELLIQLEG